jgi:hypothetical protein
MPLELAIDSLQSSVLNMRIAAADELAERGRASTVGALCNALKSETNLRVITRITRAIEKITKQPISPLDVASASKWWGENEQRVEFAFPYKPAIDAIQLAGGTEDFASRILPESAKRAIPQLKAVVDAEPQADLSRLVLVMCYVEEGQIEAATSQIETMSKNSVTTYCLPIARAAVASAQSDSAKTIDEVNQALSKATDAAALVRKWALFSFVAKDPRVKWPAISPAPTQVH